MGTAVGDFHSRLECHTVKGTGDLADAAAQFLHHFAAVVGGCRLIAFFRSSFSHHFVKGEFFSWLDDGAVYGIGRQFYVIVSLGIIGGCGGEAGQSLVAGLHIGIAFCRRR